MEVRRAIAAAAVAERRRGRKVPLAEEWTDGAGATAWQDGVVPKTAGFEAWLEGLREPDGPGFRAPVRAVGWHEEEYPPPLRGAHPSCPALFVRGRSEPLPDRRRSVAIVGARRCTDEGKWLARDLAQAAARAGLVVVSGLALGIDAAAHEGALDAGGTTVAVVAGPVDRPSPARNLRIADRIVDGGGWLVSERPPGAPVAGYDFPIRNRIVAAASAVVTVVEATERSGTLSTAAHAMRLGVAVAAVPGWPARPNSRGPNRLLQWGAHPVTCIEDVLALADRTVAPPAAPDLTAAERRVLEGVGLAVAPIEVWVRASGLPAQHAHVALRRLAAKGVLRRLGGGRMGRVR